jgi:hypothetical protein
MGKGNTGICKGCTRSKVVEITNHQILYPMKTYKNTRNKMENNADRVIDVNMNIGALSFFECANIFMSIAKIKCHVGIAVLLVIAGLYSSPCSYGQDTITIYKGDVVWQKTFSMKKYKKLIKKGTVEIEKAKISNASFLKAILQGRSYTSVINNIMSFDEINPEDAIDFIYNETKSYCQIEWIKGPYEDITEVETKKAGKKVAIIKCTTYGVFKKECAKEELNDSSVVALIKKHKIERTGVEDNSQSFSDCFNDENYDRTLFQLKESHTRARPRLAKKAVRRYKCITSEQTITLASYMYARAIPRFTKRALPYIYDVYDIYKIINKCNTRSIPRLSKAIEREISKREKKEVHSRK